MGKQKKSKQVLNKENYSRRSSNTKVLFDAAVRLYDIARSQRNSDVADVLNGAFKWIEENNPQYKGGLRDLLPTAYTECESPREGWVTVPSSPVTKPADKSTTTRSKQMEFK